MEEFNLLSVKSRPVRTVRHGLRISMASLTRIQMVDVQRERRELFTWLARYNHAVAQGAGRKHLLEIFDATFECVKKHFHSVEALLALTSWPCFQRNHVMHRELAEGLAAFRIRLAESESMDSLECAHVLDDLLIHFIKEQPVFDRLYACLDQPWERWNGTEA